MTRSLVIGGTLFIGRSLVRKLLARGHDVTILHRGAKSADPRVASLRADRNDDASLRRALERERPFDYVFDNVYDWERGTTAAQVLDTAAALPRGFRKYVFMSSVAAYADGDYASPLREDARLAGDADRDSYKRNKAASERALLASGLPVATLRPPFVYGPGNPYDREQYFWRRFAQGLEIVVPEDGSRTMQFVHVDDLAELAIVAAEAGGGAYNAAGSEIVSQLEFVRALADIAGAKPTIRFASRPCEFAEYLDLPPIPQDSSKAMRELGWSPRTLREGLAQTFQAAAR